MTRNERQLKAVDQEMARHSSDAQSIWKKADEEDRETSNEERGEVEKHLKAIETLKSQKSDLEDAIKVEQDVKQLAPKFGSADSVVNGDGSDSEGAKNYARPIQAKSIGEMLVESPQFKAIQRQGGHFSTGPIELSTKGTLLEGSGSPGSGSGGGLLPVPGVIPGVVDKLFQRLSVENLLGSIQVSGNSQRYVVEGTATSGAAGVAEGAAKPESTLGLGTTDEPIKKVATTLIISDEMLEDAPAVASYVNGRLGLFVSIESERQIVGGAGTNELIGFTDATRAINIYARGTVDNNAVALFKAINGTRGSSFMEPDAIVMNPANWQTTRLLMDANNQFYGGGPFTGAYGNTPISSNVVSGQLSGAADSLWTKPVIVTTAVGAGTALLGSFSVCAALLQRSGLTVETTNSHSDLFTKNLVAIRAERRLGLAIYRPSAFTMVTGLS